MKERSVLSWLFRRVRRRVPMIAALVLTNAGTALFGVLFALGTRGVIDGAVAADKDAFLKACLIQLFIICALLTCNTLSRYLHDKLVDTMDRDRKRQLFHSILHGKYEKVSSFHSGELVNRLNNDARILNEGVVNLLPNLVSMVVRLSGAVVVLFALEPLFTLVLFLGGLSAILVTGILRRRLKQLHKNVSKAEGKALSFIQEAAERLLVIQAMDLSGEVERRSDGLLNDRYQAQRTRRRVSLTANTAVSLLYHGAGFVALVWCARGILLGLMSFGTMTVITQLVSQLQAPFVNLSGVIPQYTAMMAAAERIMELEQACHVEDMPDSTLPEGFVPHVIRADGLTFGYHDELVLEDARFQIPTGSFTVITGTSGAGKSTLIKLFLGIFDLRSGQLCVEGSQGSIPLSRGTRGLFSYVPQGNFLFSGTLRDNLTISRPDATQSQLDRALYVSAMDEFMPELPDGLDTVLGENGAGLSEGQAQRLAIARAVLSDAPVLLLDEATSALDAETERTVLHRLADLPDRTVIAVTHRTTALDHAQCQLDVRDRTVIQTQI
ncbi:MAG: ABC transporter ATP-binding protein [Oscillospiraceae bacterium]|nr:ABC transporter ATP-binding protein [Oscillospiraceae bacterium]